MEFELDGSLKEWVKDKPLSILQLDPADRAVLRIADCYIVAMHSTELIPYEVTDDSHGVRHTSTPVGYAFAPRPIFVATDGGFTILSLDVPGYPEHLARPMHPRCIPRLPILDFDPSVGSFRVGRIDLAVGVVWVLSPREESRNRDERVVARSVDKRVGACVCRKGARNTRAGIILAGRPIGLARDPCRCVAIGVVAFRSDPEDDTHMPLLPLPYAEIPMVLGFPGWHPCLSHRASRGPSVW
ncbi:hypothetical protein WN48_07313 [Eufriesea mexicana]|uniref:Uncharacterized protein n=1 Tax=Eufriesea mexicana TaxID=516756 RepID=A0A310SMT0_9HYME|nr:hypothetical protein WN48_07313 [Eufriesea mexicana]